MNNYSILNIYVNELFIFNNILRCMNLALSGG
ncbi:hypothetical protein SAMN05428971_2320 [Candidatus Pantoea varia]|uniref:Uncharacterized protein n=1 Tax=Candidatus Pantoea varia TaxID=1881036 RepID=A0A1I5CF09_9GAMM|nr:hypothetical protein SAMN05428971_2320 [Pantoea varia]